MQDIPYADTSFRLPAPCTVYVNTVALHVSTSIWGADALSFNPARWLHPDGTIVTMPRGTYLPWSVGPRVCPGQKMAQVEFVSVVATLFRRCSARPRAGQGESDEQAKGRLLEKLQDSQPVLTLMINDPKGITIEWVGR
jgi:cytochrome P450